jgi:hypothetical protein
MVKCASARPDIIAECRKCIHNRPHNTTEDCCIKVSCVIATSRAVRGWCKEYKPPAPVRVVIPAELRAPKF